MTTSRSDMYRALRTEVVPWLTADFAFRCRELSDSNPYGDDIPPPLTLLMGGLATSLWDECFSVTEISAAFARALDDLGPYAAGEDRRGDRHRRAHDPK